MIHLSDRLKQATLEDCVLNATPLNTLGMGNPDAGEAVLVASKEVSRTGKEKLLKKKNKVLK